eukprot:6181264-Pleurochrysis_carterae.AAC.2
MPDMPRNHHWQLPLAKSAAALPLPERRRVSQKGNIRMQSSTKTDISPSAAGVHKSSSPT